jgi:hypothetical protein
MPKREVQGYSAGLIVEAREAERLIRALGRADAATLRPLVAAVLAETGRNRFPTATLLAELTAEYEDARAVVAGLAADPRCHVRVRALRCLGRNTPPAFAVEVVRAALADENAWVRLHAASRVHFLGIRGGVYWLEAEESMANAIAKSYGRGVYDWPSLSMPAFDEDVLVALWAILRNAGNDEAVTGAPLASDASKGTSVSRVKADFVQCLATLDGPAIESTITEWIKCQRLVGRRKFAEDTLQELVSFTQRAMNRCTPVLQVTDKPS